MDIIKVSWNSPYDGELRTLFMTEEQAAEWWAAASYPVQCTARFEEVIDG